MLQTLKEFLASLGEYELPLKVTWEGNLETIKYVGENKYFYVNNEGTECIDDLSDKTNWGLYKPEPELYWRWRISDSFGWRITEYYFNEEGFKTTNSGKIITNWDSIKKHKVGKPITKDGVEWDKGD